jgi:hypothetical protein
MYRISQNGHEPIVNVDQVDMGRMGTHNGPPRKMDRRG